MKDTLRMINHMVEMCFSECVTGFRSKALSSPEEKWCARPPWNSSCSPGSLLITPLSVVDWWPQHQHMRRKVLEALRPGGPAVWGALDGRTAAGGRGELRCSRASGMLAV